MPIDLALSKHTLQVLANLDGAALPMKTLASEVEILSARSLTVQDMEAVLADLQERKLIAVKTDTWGRKLYAITSNGRAMLRAM